MRDSDIPIVVFSIRNRGAFLNVLKGEGLHTVIGKERHEKD
jgi:uridylate kinase